MNAAREITAKQACKEASLTIGRKLCVATHDFQEVTTTLRQKLSWHAAGLDLEHEPDKELFRKINVVFDRLKTAELAMSKACDAALQFGLGKD